MLEIKEIPVEGYEIVIEASDPEVGLHAFIAVHNTVLGPALGGTRIYPYQTPEEALKDVLRLSKGMTYKSAVVEDGLGGGKSVIIADPRTHKTPELLRAFGSAVDTLKGKYIVAEDVGSTTEDMMMIRTATPYVAALPLERSSGDPSRFTAWGVYRGIQAVSQILWKTPSLRGRTVAIQGTGSVGDRLARFLFWEGVDLILSDVDESKVHPLAHKDGAIQVDPKEIYDVECDIFAPCALGGILNAETIPRLKCKAVAGSANNQLALEEDAELLFERGILYAPDFIVNSGGIINASAEFEPGGYNPKTSRDRVNRIYDKLLKIFEIAELEGKTTSQVANEIAEYNIQHRIGKRKQPIQFQ